MEAERGPRRKEPDDVDDRQAAVRRYPTAQIHRVERGRRQSLRRRSAVLDFVNELQLDWTGNHDEPQRHHHNVDEQEQHQATEHCTPSCGQRQIPTTVYQTAHADEPLYTKRHRMFVGRSRFT